MRLNWPPIGLVTALAHVLSHSAMRAALAGSNLLCNVIVLAVLLCFPQLISGVLAAIS